MAKGLWTILNVDNVEKSVEFYKALGLKTRVDMMDVPGMPSAPMGTIVAGDTGLLLWNKNIVAPGQAADTKAWVSGELGKGVMFSIGVPNAEKVWANAQKVRAQIDQPLRKQEWGGHEFTVVDLDGYVVNVTDKFPTSAKPAKRAAKRVKAVAKKVAKATRKRR